jgi:hypothetical protein
MPKGCFGYAEPVRVWGHDASLEPLRDNPHYKAALAGKGLDAFVCDPDGRDVRCWEQGRVDAIAKRGRTLAEVGGLTKLDARKVA